jgi:hypothetical protein
MDLEACATVVDLLAQSHGYGESIASKVEFWIGVSSGLIVMAYFAPDRLKPGITSLVLLLYVTFSVFTATNMQDDGALGAAAVQDAIILETECGIQSKVLAHRLDDSQAGRGSTIAGMVTFLGLFLGTIGYVVSTAWNTRREDSSGDT